MAEDVNSHAKLTITRFQHSVVGTRAIDTFNDLRDMPVLFQAVDRQSPNINIVGGLSTLLSAWSTRSSSGFLSLPKAPVDVFTLRFVTAGAMLRRNRSSEHASCRGHAMFVPFDRMQNEEATADFESVGGTITRTAVMRCHAALHGADAGPLPNFEAVADLDRPPMWALLHTLRSLIARLEAGVGGEDVFLPLLEEVVAYQLLSVWPQSPARPRASLPSSRLVRMAAEYVDANLARKLTLTEVAAAAGMSVRSLQAAFRQALGQTPVQFIMERRLARVRDDLCVAGAHEPISAVAERWGFHHMGEFSRRYRLKFGETPREARRRARL